MISHLPSILRKHAVERSHNPCSGHSSSFVDAVETVAEGDVIARLDAEIANLVINRLEAREHVLHGFLNAPAPTNCSGGTMSNATRSGAYDDIMRRCSWCESLHETVDHCPDRGTFFRSVVVAGHGIASGKARANTP